MTFATPVLLESLDKMAQESERYQTFVRALEDTHMSKESGVLIEGLRALWSKAPAQATLYDLIPHHSREDHVASFGIEDYHMGYVIAPTWLLLCEMLPTFEDTVTVEGPLSPEGMVIEGSLHVTGDLVAGEYSEDTPNLIVLGDLIVDGDWTWDGDVIFVRGDVFVRGKMVETSEWSQLVIGGDVRVGGALSSQGVLIVGGDVRAPVVTLTYNHGWSILLGHTHALFFQEHDHGRSWLAYAPSATVVSFLDLHFGQDPSNNHGKTQQRLLEDLQSLLTPSYQARVLAGYAWDDEEEIVTCDGEYVSVEDVLQEISSHLTLGEDEYADVQPPLSDLLGSTNLTAFEDPVQHRDA